MVFKSICVLKIVLCTQVASALEGLNVLIGFVICISMFIDCIFYQYKIIHHTFQTWSNDIIYQLGSYLIQVSYNYEYIHTREHTKCIFTLL